ncbi:hypothetical protein OEZ85_005266 [Tetradesmus obliquus]|uniref:DUF4110 domain-containing protein n=1 Tax=Tetradesmus obliquus TaxID=3088 RepID=A0ABY8UHS4_TETOB|nr:hypothetical protein OEZ85_005266 [Tetradesmus obliquus]
MKWSHCYTSLADPGLSLPRFGHSAVCVNAKANWGSDLVVVYGGVGSAAGESAQTALGDVVVLQVDNGTWSVPDILPGPNPGARAFHCAVALGQRLLLFGGHILTFDAEHNRKRRTFFNDVWQMDTEDWQWAKLPVDPVGPSPLGRDMASLLLLDESTLLLFGGRSEAGKSLQDCWLFDVERCCWQQLKPEGPLPAPRKMHGMVKLGSQVVLFGGERDSGPLDDLWVLRGWQPGATARWTQVKVKASPAPRFGHTLAVASLPAAAPGTAASEAGSSSTGGGAEEPLPSAAAAAAGSTPEAASYDAAGSVAATPRASSSGGVAAAADGQQQQRVVLFGGCLDLSSFLSLNRNYVQSKEAWLLDMSSLTWVQLPAADEAGAGPCERMCHSMTPLPDGRMLLLGGRQKEGICKDLWWLDAAGELTVPPSPSGSQQSLTGSATQARPGSQQSLLQSLLGPIREGQAGALAGALPAALSRVAPNLLPSAAAAAAAQRGGSSSAASSQHLMSSAVAQLHVAQVALLLADYQHLAATYFEHQLLARLSQGFAAAVGHAEQHSSLNETNSFKVLLHHANYHRRRAVAAGDGTEVCPSGLEPGNPEYAAGKGRDGQGVS